MSPIKIREFIPRRCCSDIKLKELRKAGIKTDGYEYSLEKIITDKGYGLPVRYDEEYFGFILNSKYTRLCYNYADCLAEEILLLHNLKIL